MFKTLFHTMSRKPSARRSMGLEIESLEGRDMPSTLAAVAGADWPPPPAAKFSQVAVGDRGNPNGVHLLGGVKVGADAMTRALGGGGTVNPNGAQPLASVKVSSDTVARAFGSGGTGDPNGTQPLGGIRVGADAIAQVFGGGATIAPAVHHEHIGEEIPQ